LVSWSITVITFVLAGHAANTVCTRMQQSASMKSSQPDVLKCNSRKWCGLHCQLQRNLRSALHGRQRWTNATVCPQILSSANSLLTSVRFCCCPTFASTTYLAHGLNLSSTHRLISANLLQLLLIAFFPNMPCTVQHAACSLQVGPRCLALGYT